MTTQDRGVPEYNRTKDFLWTEIGLCSAGFLMFLVTVLVLWKQKLQSAYTRILIQTAVLDVLYLGSILTSDIFYILFDLKIFHIQTVMSMILLLPVTMTFITAQVYMVGTLVIKYIVVMLEPIKYELSMGEKRTCFNMVGVWIFSIAYNYPHWHAYMPAVIASNHHNYTWPKVWKDEEDRFINTKFYNRIFGTYMLCVFEFLVPITVFIAGLVIVRHSQNSDDSDEDNIVRSTSRTRLLEVNKSLYKAVWYIIMTTLLTRIITACFFTWNGPSYCPEVHGCMFSDHVMRIIYISNAIAKFFIYIFSWPYFRQAIHECLCCVRTQPLDFV